MSFQVRSVALMFVIALFASGWSAVEAAPGDADQDVSTVNTADLYYDYKVVAFQVVLGGWDEFGPFDTRQQALAVAFHLMMHGYHEDIHIVRVSAWSTFEYR